MINLSFRFSVQQTKYATSNMSTDEEKLTPLFRAVHNDDVNLVRQLLKDGEDLHIACRLSFDFNFMYIDCGGLERYCTWWSAIQLAALNGNNEMIELLLSTFSSEREAANYINQIVQHGTLQAAFYNRHLRVSPGPHRVPA